MQRRVMALKKKGRSIGFVPTMGALHAGHVSLIRRARKDHDIVIVSIFVNPLQFGPKEDFTRYPRPISKDKQLCLKEGVDFIFYPSAQDMYSRDFKTRISVKDLGDVLCGQSRPGHFEGVATVVAKLFNITQPDTAYFGQKDCQQTVIIQRMAEELNIPVKIQVMPTIREKDGLAMSSRNVYLSAQDRAQAFLLHQALTQAKDMLKKGVRDSAKITGEMKRIIGREGVIDYIAVADLKSLLPVRRIDRNSPVLIALAVRMGKTRLIDNVIIGKKITKINYKG